MHNHENCTLNATLSARPQSSQSATHPPQGIGHPHAEQLLGGV
jgi:hypothetical protein